MSVCAYCRQRPADPQFRPFCSERCKMADLGRWLKGDYRVPVRPDDYVEDDPDAVADAPEESERS